VTEEMLKASSDFRAEGWSPIPFRRGQKKPALKTGQIARYRKTPASPAQLRRWFEHSDHQVGFITGASPYPLVLDIDGDEGRQSIKGLPMPPTRMVDTSDGFHAYFATDEVLETRIKALPGVDVLCSSWQVLAPPSLHPDGHRYRFHEFLTDCNLAPLPSWIRDLVRATPTAGRTDTPQKNQDTEDGRARVILDTCTTSKPLTPKEVRALFASAEANRAVADFLGLPALGSTFLCPWHPEREPSMSLFCDVHTRAWKLHDHHRRGDHTYYGLADVFASGLLGHEVRLEGTPSLVTWWLRALLACKFLEAAEVPKRALPVDVRPAVRTVYDGFIMLLQAKWRYDPGRPSMFTTRFAMDWCGISSSQTVQEALWWLVRHGYIRQVGREKCSWTYLPGDDLSAP
jgi:Bifunctional DNA primase/polymerase, N-terminal